MAEKIENHLTEQLCEAMASLKSKTLIANFLEDVCTISEYSHHLPGKTLSRLRKGRL